MAKNNGEPPISDEHIARRRDAALLRALCDPATTAPTLGEAPKLPNQFKQPATAGEFGALILLSLLSYDPKSIIHSPFGAELGILESLADGLSGGKRRNAIGAHKVAIFLRLARISFCLSPVMSFGAAAVRSSLRY
jgi:hypothetical protein